MPKKKSIKKAADEFEGKLNDLDAFIAAASSAELQATHVAWAHDYAIIRAYETSRPWSSRRWSVQ